MKFLQRCVLYLVYAFDLTHQQFRVAYYFERLVSVLDRVLKRRDQALILREIIGLMTEILAERGNFPSRFILNHHAVACRPGIAAGAAVTMSDQVFFGVLACDEENKLRDG